MHFQCLTFTSVPYAINVPYTIFVPYATSSALSGTAPHIWFDTKRNAHIYNVMLSSTILVCSALFHLVPYTTSVPLMGPSLNLCLISLCAL